ncbi:PerC family transcriptional regulator [Buttiauxella selenatireducens]|uniref:PerC family transcriptional regulator n=1 Tax=Buttiauxella selenatireducens TaxID=3073902 RepID=A0ABY9S938_9ENTR|nr:PerC family transcriptional regulator [Buttiauxella sp. R73]WMY72577.1 PerC family transcriptional regulator [Buttiauxella sp. R73]
MPSKPVPKIEFVSDEIAETLEKAGLWRRAAARWLVVFDEHLSPGERVWISERRNKCLRQAARPPMLLDNFGDVRRAVDATQRKMGIDKPGGKAFRLV